MTPNEPRPPGEIVLYQTEHGRTRLQVRLEDETVWLRQAQMAELFQTTIPNESMHIRNGYAYVFIEEGSSFVPDGTRFLIAPSPSDKSLGYFRASLGDFGSRCMRIRSNKLVACDRFPFELRSTRVSWTSTDSKVPSGTTENNPRFQPWVAEARMAKAPQGRKKTAHLAPIQDQRGGRGLTPARGAKAPLWPRRRALAAGRRDGRSGRFIVRTSRRAWNCATSQGLCHPEAA